MNRRDALKQTALMTGYALSFSALAGIASSCQTYTRPDWTPQFFSKEQGDMIADMVARLFPTTSDAPGGIEVGVHEFVDTMVGEWYQEKDQPRFVEGLAQIDARFQEKYSKPMIECSGTEQIELLSEIDAEERAKMLEEDKNPVKDGEKDPWHALAKFKWLALMGYFGSQQVATEVLAYDPIPGNYDGCVPLADVGGKNWSLR